MNTTNPALVHRTDQRPSRHGQRPVPPQRQHPAVGRWSAKEAVISIDWLPEPIHALGSATGLGFIVGVSRWKASKLAQAGEWQQAGIYIAPTCSKYRLAAQRPLQIPSYGDRAKAASERTPSASDQKRIPRNARDDAAVQPSRPVPVRGRL